MCFCVVCFCANCEFMRNNQISIIKLQFWGAEKETHRLETAIFDDLNRYCWNQQSNNLTTTNSPSSSGQVVNPDGQVSVFYFFYYQLID